MSGSLCPSPQSFCALLLSDKEIKSNKEIKVFYKQIHVPCPSQPQMAQLTSLCSPGAVCSWEAMSHFIYNADVGMGTCMNSYMLHIYWRAWMSGEEHSCHQPLLTTSKSLTMNETPNRYPYEDQWCTTHLPIKWKTRPLFYPGLISLDPMRNQNVTSLQQACLKAWWHHIQNQLLTPLLLQIILLIAIKNTFDPKVYKSYFFF